MRAVVFAYSNVGDRCLRVLHARGIDIPLVVTHADRPGEIPWFQCVADTAMELRLPMCYGEDLSAQELESTVASARPDVVFSFYYRAMLPLALLALAPKGAFNMHGSLLPKYRGRAPTNWAVLRGETETGASLHHMVAKPDAGAIVDQSSVPILPDDTGQQVFDKVTVAAEKVLWRSLDAIKAGTAPGRLNDLAQGSYFGARAPEDGRIDWRRPAREVYNLIRAVAPPYPGAFSDIDGTRLVIAKARLGILPLPEAAAGLAPGLACVEDRMIGVCGDASFVEIHALHAAGRSIDHAELAHLLAARKDAPLS